MTKKSNLYLFTFLSIFFSLFLVGAVISPIFLKTIRSTYLVMNMDVNRHQAEIVANIMGKLLAVGKNNGENQNTIIKAFQASLAKTNMDRTYLCLVDVRTNIFLAHPLVDLVGKSAKQFIVNYSAGTQKMLKNKALTTTENKLNPGAILTTAEGRTEIVNSFLVPSTNLRVFAHENINRLNQDIIMFQKEFIIIFILLGFVVAFPASYAALKVSRRYEQEIEAEQATSERLLLNILPASIAQRLKAEERNIANRYEDVSVLFIDMVDFTPLAAKLSPEDLVALLNHVFSKFDAISLKYGLEKIKTIGDAYMVVGGIPELKKDHLKCCIDAGLEMMAFISSEYNASGSNHLQVRMGLHTGPVVAGVIGAYKFIYDLWGETVNIASRLESTSLPGHIQCSDKVYEQMKNQYVFVPRGNILLKGMGPVPTYFLMP